MASRKNSPVMRVDPRFVEDMRKMAKVRLNKGLAKFKPKEISTTEMTRLLRRTQGYQLSLKELMTKPKRRQNG